MQRCWRTLCLVLLGALALSRPAWATPLRIDFFDVGQGDAALITSPTGKTTLIDGGPPEAAHRLSARLRARMAPAGGPLDLILLTHRHLDHLGGLGLIVEDVGTRLYLDPAFEHPTPAYATLVERLAAHHVPVRNAEAGRKIDLGGGAWLTLLGPPSPPLRRTRSDVNANSIVARLDYGQVRVLFAADMEPQTERWLLRQDRAALRADVVKVPHHGSHYSSTVALVRAVAAPGPEARQLSLAVISVGARNDYHHPSEDVIARWTNAGARVHRTDRDGDLSLVTEGERIDVVAGAPTHVASPNLPSTGAVAP